MGPTAFRIAGLPEILQDLGWTVTDVGDAVPTEMPDVSHSNPAVRNLDAIIAWTKSVGERAYEMAKACDFPIFLGGDHSMSAGTVSGVARHSQDLDQPQFVLWLDAHTDLHTLHTTTSGNLHGTPVAYFTGQSGFEGFPAPAAPVDPHNMCMMGIRSVDQAEKRHVAEIGITVFDMRAIDEQGIVAPLNSFLDRVRAANGRLHVSLDVDFLDPDIAPAVGTTVCGGATFREAHLIAPGSWQYLAVCPEGNSSSVHHRTCRTSPTVHDRIRRNTAAFIVLWGGGPRLSHHGADDGSRHQGRRKALFPLLGPIKWIGPSFSKHSKRFSRAFRLRCNWRQRHSVPDLS